MGWTTKTDSLIANVEKIKFDAKGEILEMISYSRRTGVRAIFKRMFADQKGEYHQPGEIGIWYLKKSSYGHIGTMWDDKGKKATFFVQKK